MMGPLKPDDLYTAHAAEDGAGRPDVLLPMTYVGKRTRLCSVGWSSSSRMISSRYIVPRFAASLI
jgi:hypothetical protein